MLRPYLARSLHRRPHLRRTYTDAPLHQSLPSPLSTFDFQLPKAPPMKFIRYAKYTGEPADSVDLEELIKRLGDFFLQSGFESQYYGLSEFDPEKTMEALRQAILRALAEGDLLPEDLLEQLTKESSAKSEQELRELLDRLIERMMEEGYINGPPPQVTPPPDKTPRGHLGGDRDA